MEDAIFIAGNVASSKNSKTWTGKHLVNSKQSQSYIRSSKQDYLDNTANFLAMLEDKEKPYRVSFTFVRKSKHKFDYINPCQTVQDLMVKYEWIEDDNCDEIIPVFEPYIYDKDNPGVYIKVL